MALEKTESAKVDGGHSSQIFLVKPHLRLAQHFDLEVDLLIYDEVLGTLGLVHQLREKGATLAAEVQGLIDRATYVRHLMLNDLKRGARLPLTVELAFLAQYDHLHEIGNTLSRVARETPSFLEAVGVSLLTYRTEGEPFALADMRRAFPWLLQATRVWYKDRPRAEPTAALTGIELLEYRLPGRRTLRLKPSPVHLIFGQNGSGKSALVEALELAVTGKAERLGVGDVDYVGVIRSRRATGPTASQVILHLSDQSIIEREVGPGGISLPLCQDLRATSFRLDQTVMDRLTRGGDTQRAEIFLQSFFPAEHADLLTYQRSREEAEKILSELPTALKELLASEHHDGKDPEEGLLRLLSWLEESQSHLPPAIAAACLPLSAENIRALGALSPELTQLQITWSQEPPTVAEAAAKLGRIDEALARLRDSLPTVLETLRIARQGLLRIEGWQATGGGTESARDFLADVNDWLRRCALTDLAERHCQLLEALSEAQRAGWEPELDSIGPFAQPPVNAHELAAQRKQASDWARERDELFQRVMAVTPAAAGGTGRPSAEVVRPSRVQKEQLDIAGRWLLSATDSNHPLLGQAIEQALNTDRSLQVGDIAVGTEAWAQPLLARLIRLEAAVQALQESSASGGRNFQALKDLHSSYVALKAAGGKVEQSFLRQLQGREGSRLVEALNELMAVFTPARWAYEDIDLRYRDGAAAQNELGFQIGESVQAALSLNTAQLNLFTVALFLLCAVRADNPLGLMVLDDPLQNMDELTVTTLARGIAKVSRLWSNNWRLLLFFHGQEDRERFRREVPLAAYQLPWLSLGEGGGSRESDPISVDEAVYDDGLGLQLLTEVATDLSAEAGE
jgi:energy-coupling factor transporter ATP-binding protein EcfA2